MIILLSIIVCLQLYTIYLIARKLPKRDARGRFTRKK